MKIVLVRHGESEANVADRINDNPYRPVNLTLRGEEQADVAATKLLAYRFTQAYTSEFPRARQTAAILLQNQSCPVQIDARLNERRTGMDGQPVNVFNDQVLSDPLHFKTELGESFLEQMARVRLFLDEASQRHPEGIVLAVSHENPILAALALTVNDPRDVVFTCIGNCEWVELAWPA